EKLCESCVVARGGGASEDLSAFNDEALARAAARSTVPLVSAVGHEVDYSILDMVADARAATPTAACRLLTQPIAQLYELTLGYASTLDRRIGEKLTAYQSRIQKLSLMLSVRSPQNELKKNRQSLEFLVKSLESLERTRLDKLCGKVTNDIERLELVNPAQLLKRGYSITAMEERVIIDCKQLKIGDHIATRLRDGVVTSSVIGIEKKEVAE
ncbi:MAG: exodeoxyribonuclease VII large subunit, partial [Angelakisella sp.]